MCNKIISLCYIMTSEMPRMNISLSKEKMQELRQLSESENRKYSQQIIHMMEFYIKHKDNGK